MSALETRRAEVLDLIARVERENDAAPRPCPDFAEYLDLQRMAAHLADADTLESVADDVARYTNADPAAVRRLSDAFADTIRAALTADQWAEMRRRNASPEYQSGTCASGDYLDSGAVMADAFRRTFGRECAYGDSGADTRLWDDAWDDAWRRHLTAPGRAAELERARLESLADDVAYGGHRAFALESLALCPLAAFRARFLGELFYGRTEAEALRNVREFARDADALETYEDEGVRVDALPTEPEA